MADISKNTEVKFTLDGKKFNAPIDWQDITIEAEYENDSVQPSLSIEDFTFPLESREEINQWISDGNTGGVGIFEGMPMGLTLFNNTSVQHNFDSFIDFTNGYRDLLQDGRVDVSIIKDDGVDNFFDQLGVTTFGFLESVNAVTQNDYINVDYVVEKKFNLVEILISSIVLFMMVKELIEAIDRVINAIADVVTLAVSSAISSAAAAILAVLKALIAIAYATLILIAIINLSMTLFETLSPIKRTHKAIMFRRALEVICEHFGYTLDAPIDELDFVAYLPSNPRQDDKTFFGLIDKTHGTPTGIPNSLDGGYYNCAEFFQRAKDLFKAKISIVNKVVILRPKIDDFWVQTSTFNLPSVELQQLQYNTSDLKAEKILSFSIDFNDEWTIDDKVGRAYEIKTSPKTTIRKNAVLLKGIEEIDFLASLGTRKDELNAIENLLLFVASSIDEVTQFFGGGTNFAGQIKSKIGVLKQSNNWSTLPKLLYIKGGKLPVNHRSLWSAQLLYEKYHIEDSFVLDNARGQKVVYEDVTIPFGFEDFNTLLTNSFFKFKGSDAKITKFTWTIGRDKANVSFWVREKYTDNLQETCIDLSQ